MIVVVFALMLMYRMQVPDRLQRISHPIPWAYAIIAMGYITFWAALRSGFVDTRAYIIAFDRAPMGITAAMEAFHAASKGPLWNAIQILFKTYISQDFHYWLTLIAIATAIPIIITLRRKSVDYLFSIFLFITSTIFSWMFNGIRQFLVVAILFGFYNLIIERRRILFLVLILICSMIHSSALIMIPAIFLIDFKPFGKMMWLFVLTVVASSFFVGTLMGGMESLLQDSVYYGNLEQFADDDGAHPLRVLFTSVPVIFAFIKKQKIEALNNTFVNLCINMSTVAAGLMFIAMLTSGIMIGRFPVYYEMYNFILIPYLINCIYTDYKRILYIGFYIVYMLFYYLLTQHYYYVSDILGNYF